jgi:hypothetical protein
MKKSVKKTIKHRKGGRRHNGGGYTMPYAYYNAPGMQGLPVIVNPFASVPSTNATSSMIRPGLNQTGGTRKKLKGGFSPSVMGPFIQNAQAAIVPAVLYTIYHTMVPKKSKK